MERDEIDRMAAEIEKEPAPAAPAPAPAENVEGPAPSQPAPPPLSREAAGLRAALHAEREKRRAMEARIADMERASKPKDAESPDPKVDPVGYLAWQREHYGKDLEERQQREAEELKSTREREAQQEAMNTYLEAYDEFQEAVSDFGEAYAFLVKWGHDQLRAQGVRNPMVRQQQQAMFELQFVQGAISQGLNPAEAVYNKARELGYGQTQADQQQNPAAYGAPAQDSRARDPQTGQFVPNQPAVPAPAPRSLSHARGGPAATLDEEELLRNPQAFDKLLKDPDAWRRMHGRT